ncbi:MAG TPA: monofunctional biosynthetic peptidoglycan transglycosylase [Anaeromyxobacteraceae bacterium]|nr:monofunctional biosynthetic peptidoglycan transglycosylase [Anaeromyxobacteraceae bacterium]
MPAARSLVPPRIARVLLWTLAAAGAFLLLVGAMWIALPDPLPLARENPKTTALIEQRKAEAKEKHRAFRVRQSWVGLDRVSRRMVDAVVMSEDARFFGHDGFDWAAMRDAAKHDLAKGSFARGASTLTQQLAKNLWYGTNKSLWRKAKEAVLASKLEHALSKRRILALYLGVAEWGDGVFGVEAGARARFGVSAAQLTTAQAVVMASMLPAPRRVDLAHPSRWLRSRSHRLLDRMRDEGAIGNEEHLRASAELEQILAGPAPAGDTEEVPSEEEPEDAPLVVSTPAREAPAAKGEGPEERREPAAETEGTRAAADAAQPTPSPGLSPAEAGERGEAAPSPR